MTTTTSAKPILITGGTGKVGSRLIPRVLAQGEPVRALVRDPESEAALRLRTAGAELVVGDLTTLDAAGFKDAVDGTAAVIHLAATFREAPTPERATAVNTDGSTALAEAALDAGVTRFVFASTNLVYGGGHNAPQDEQSELGPIAWGGAYPESKIAAEKSLQELRTRRGLDLRVVRLAFVYGDGDPHIAEFMQRPLDWHSSRRLQMVHHADVAQGVLLALHAQGLSGEVFNIADDSAATLAEIYRHMGRELTPEMAERAVTEPWFGIVQNAKARRVLGFRPLYPTMWQAVDAGTM
jgi:dihydroflavonol-4-reductase